MAKVGHRLSFRFYFCEIKEERRKRSQYTQYDLTMELLIEHGFEGIAESIAILMNPAMQFEQSRHLNAAPYERSELRKGYVNEYKPKTMVK